MTMIRMMKARSPSQRVAKAKRQPAPPCFRSPRTQSLLSPLPRTCLINPLIHPMNLMQTHLRHPLPPPLSQSSPKILTLRLSMKHQSQIVELWRSRKERVPKVPRRQRKGAKEGRQKPQPRQPLLTEVPLLHPLRQLDPAHVPLLRSASSPTQSRLRRRSLNQQRRRVSKIGGNMRSSPCSGRVGLILQLIVGLGQYAGLSGGLDWMDGLDGWMDGLDWTDGLSWMDYSNGILFE